MGHLYRRKLRSGKRSDVWWVKYYAHGVPVRESTGATRKPDAKQFMQEREGRVATGAAIQPKAEKILYDEIAADLVTYYETTGRRDAREAGQRLKHLGKFFEKTPAVAITPDQIDRYVRSRQEAGAANATINRELATLGKMLRLGYKYGKVGRLPVIEKLEEAAPREGFFEEEQYHAVVRRLPADLQVAAAIAQTFGWRTQSEILTRERRHLDLEAGTLRLDPGETKNRKGRVVYLTAALEVLLREQFGRVDALQRRLGRIVPSLFPHLTNGRRYKAGDRRKDYRKAWLTACREAGVPGRLRHDLRRTAVRNMVNDGIAERVAMTVTGHQTRNVFDRYHIVSPADLQRVARVMDERRGVGHALVHTLANGVS